MLVKEATDVNNETRGAHNDKDISCTYVKSHCNNKIVVGLLYVSNWDICTGKAMMKSLHWKRSMQNVSKLTNSSLNHSLLIYYNEFICYIITWIQLENFQTISVLLHIKWSWLEKQKGNRYKYFMRWKLVESWVRWSLSSWCSQPLLE